MNIAIVGSNRGIGLEFCTQLASEHKVYAFCRQASEDLKKLDLKYIENTDVRDLASLQTAAATLKDEKVDCLIHVAGILESQSLDDFDVAAVRKQFEVNSIGPILSVKAFLPYLSDQAKVALLTSRMGSIADNDSGGQYGYRMSKAALNAAGKSLALDLKPRGISVFLLHPGYVKTDMTDHNGLIDTKESVTGLWKLITSKDIKQSGGFWHTNGEELPW